LKVDDNCPVDGENKLEIKIFKEAYNYEYL